MNHPSLSVWQWLMVLALAEVGLPPWRAGAALREENFDHEPATWEGINNRNPHFAPRTVTQDFGWSPTHWAGGQAAGELGGLIFRGDCREPHRLAAYDDRIATLTLDLKPGARAIGASFDRFGICTPWIDGNSVTVYFDDLQYTCSPMDIVPK